MSSTLILIKKIGEPNHPSTPSIDTLTILNLFYSMSPHTWVIKINQIWPLLGQIISYYNYLFLMELCAWFHLKRGGRHAPRWMAEATLPFGGWISLLGETDVYAPLFYFKLYILFFFWSLDYICYHVSVWVWVLL